MSAVGVRVSDGEKRGGGRGANGSEGGVPLWLEERDHTVAPEEGGGSEGAEGYAAPAPRCKADCPRERPSFT